MTRARAWTVSSLSSSPVRTVASGHVSTSSRADPDRGIPTGASRPSVPTEPWLGLGAICGSFGHRAVVLWSSVDTLDIIRQMEADPALLARVRAVVLTEEVLNLPQRIAELDARLTAQIAELDARLTAQIAELDARLTAQIGKLTDHLATFVAATDLRFEEVDRRLDKIEGRLTRVENGVGMLKGHALEMRLRDEPRRYLSRLLRRASAVDLDDLIGAKVLDEIDEDIWRLDAVVEGDLRSTGEHVLCTVEVSWSVHVDDLERSARRAAVLARLINVPTVPVAISEQGPGVAVVHRAAQLGVTLVEAGSPEPLFLGKVVAPPAA